jgi:hypothetical protein
MTDAMQAPVVRWFTWRTWRVLLADIGPDQRFWIRLPDNEQSECRRTMKAGYVAARRHRLGRSLRRKLEISLA